jgi:hypothetical protein
MINSLVKIGIAVRPSYLLDLLNTAAEDSPHRLLNANEKVKKKTVRARIYPTA